MIIDKTLKKLKEISAENKTNIIIYIITGGFLYVRDKGVKTQP